MPCYAHLHQSNLIIYYCGYLLLSTVVDFIHTDLQIFKKNEIMSWAPQYSTCQIYKTKSNKIEMSAFIGLFIIMCINQDYIRNVTLEH